LRKRGSSYEITKKTLINSDDSSAQLEQTLPLELAEFESLASGHSRMVEKDRYGVSIGTIPAEVDVFSGKLEGLILIDFEFESEAAKATFVPPLCCLADVTQEEFIAGGSLAGKSYDDIAENLAHFGYQPLNM
jgi:CYTH domain-containing protein